MEKSNRGDTRGLHENPSLSGHLHVPPIKGDLHVPQLKEISETEQRMIAALECGKTVVVSMRKGGQAQVIKWAKTHHCFVRIDRQTPWGNPFEIGKHGNRESVIEQYAVYLQGKPSLMKALPTLRGKALGCWCAPEPCHGDVLVRLLNKT